MLLIYYFDRVLGSLKRAWPTRHERENQNFEEQVEEEGIKELREVNVPGWTRYERAGKCAVPRFYGAERKKERMRSISNSARVTFAEGEGWWQNWCSCALPAGVRMEKVEEVMQGGCPMSETKQMQRPGDQRAPCQPGLTAEYHAGS